MVGWASIPGIYKVYSYLKKYFDLNERDKALTAKEEKLKKEEQELSKLRTISNENFQNPSSMIDFYPSYPFVNALDNLSSPYLEFQFNITNRSILDFKTKSFFMKFFKNEESEGDLDSFGNISEIGQIEISREINVPHQQIVSTTLKLPLHPNFINKLKSLKKEHKTLHIQLLEIKIDFIGDKEFYQRGAYNWKIPWDEIRVNL